MHSTAAGSPTAQLIAASAAVLTVPALPLWLAISAAAVPTIYYLLLTLDYLRNWKASPTPATLGSALATLTGIWKQDKPMLIAGAMLAYAGAQYAHLPIPAWISTLAMAAGLVIVHNVSKQTTLATLTPVSASIAPLVEKIVAAAQPEGTPKP
jgi:hypothetical protein